MTKEPKGAWDVLKERLYVKDKVDGVEHCLSGDKSFFLIEISREVNEAVQALLFSERQKAYSEGWTAALTQEMVRGRLSIDDSQEPQKE